MEKSLPLEKVIHIIKPHSASVLNLYMYKFESDLMCSWLLKGREWWSHRRWPKRWRLIRFASSIYWLFVCLFDSTVICCSSCKYALFVTTFLELLSMWYLVYLQRLFVSEYCIFSVKRVVRICLIGCGFDVSSLEK